MKNFYWTANTTPATPAFVPEVSATPATPAALPLTLPEGHPLVAEADARAILATPVAEDAEPSQVLVCIRQPPRSRGIPDMIPDVPDGPEVELATGTLRIFRNVR